MNHIAEYVKARKSATNCTQLKIRGVESTVIYAPYVEKVSKVMNDYMPDQPTNDYAREAFEAKIEDIEENVFDVLEYEVNDVVKALNELECGLRYMLEYRGLDTDWRRYDGEFFVSLKNAIDFFGG